MCNCPLRRYYLFGSPLVVYDDTDDFYLTAPSPLGPWSYKGLFAPAGSRTYNSQVFKGLQVPGERFISGVTVSVLFHSDSLLPCICTGSKGTTNVFIGTRWCNPYPSVTPPPPAVCPPTCVCHPPFRNTTSIWLPLQFAADGSVATLKWQDTWDLDVASEAVSTAGTNKTEVR